MRSTTSLADAGDALSADLRLAVQLEGLGKRFGFTRALRRVDLDVGWGEVVGLVGPNGSGKTTLLRILGGALRPTEGSARMAGRSLEAHSDDVRGRVGLLSGDHYLYGDLTAAENLRFAWRMSRPEAPDGEIETLLVRVGLDGIPDRRVRAFSSGMRKRLALARALLLAPRILLLDEPWSSLDAEAMGLVDTVIREWRGRRRAVLVATHRRDRIGALADRLVRLERGRASLSEAVAPASFAPEWERGLTGVEVAS